ncbi:MAG: ATP-grasp domain-containing protein [Myxococcales bacterium]|nr:ATP-grasp domain-containing protein [Myxococcales bacterium]
MSNNGKQAPRTALLGFCIPAMEALDKVGRPFLAVVPPEFEAYMQEHDIAHVLWDFSRVNETSMQLSKTLQERGVEVAVPLFEETVEWAGAVNGFLRDDPRLFTRYLLFRDKAMMKRRAQMYGIRVGVFEEADNREDVSRFFKRVNKALSKLDSDVADPVHLKPLAAAGCVGHRFIRSEQDIAVLQDDEFPCLLETHLDGQEFSCEVFIHDSKIRFLNITEYVHLGHSNFVPASPSLEERRPYVRKAVEELIDAFGIQYGMIHPEFFITSDNKINFGEVAARVPGGHIFELIEKAYGFSPFVAFAMCSDPATTDEELAAYLPDERQHKDYAGCLMVYPRQKIVTRVDVPDRLIADDYYEKHALFQPVTPKVAERAGFGDHYGTVYFRGDNSARMRDLLLEYEQVDFYTSDAPAAS